MSRPSRSALLALWLASASLPGCRLGYELIEGAQQSPGVGDAGVPDDTGNGGGGQGQSGAGSGGDSLVGSGGAGGRGGSNDGGGGGSGGGGSNAGNGGSGGGAAGSGGTNGGNGGAGGDPDATTAGVDAGGVADCGNATLEPGEECEPSLSAPEDLCQSDCRFDWFDRAYAKRRRVRFANAAATAALSGFVVPVPLDAGVVSYGDLEPSGEDLLFLDADHVTELPYEIESWNPGGVSVVWVRVPTLDASATDYVWLYEQSPGASARQAPADVWDASFAAVFHLDGDATDSKGPNDGAFTATTSIAGQLANGFDFDGASSSVNAGSDASVDDLFTSGATLTAWIRPASWGEGGYGRIADKASATVANQGWAFEIHDGAAPTHTLRFELGFDVNFGGWNGTAESIVIDAWSHVAVVKDGTLAAPAMYLNGQTQVVTEVSVPAGVLVTDANLGLGIGDFLVDNSRSFDGVLDEVRIQRTLRDANWVATEHRSALPGFVTFDVEQGILVTEYSVKLEGTV